MPKLADVYRTTKGRKVIATALTAAAAIATGGAVAAPEAAMSLLQVLAAFFGG